MTIYDILRQTTFTEISEKIQKFHGVNNIDKYAELYHKLYSVSPNYIGEKLTVYITAYRVTDSDNDDIVEHFDESDTSLYYDVSAYDDSDEVYSIASSDYSDFLQFSIDATTLKNYSYSTILAHCFYEITTYGFDRQ